MKMKKVISTKSCDGISKKESILMKKKYLLEDENWLMLQYWGNDLTLSEIGKLIGCSNYYVVLWMNKYNIPRKTKPIYIKELWKNAEFKEKMKIKQREKFSLPEQIKQKSKITKKLWQDPEYRRIQKEARIKSWTNERKEKVSKKIKESWKDQKIRENRINGIYKYYKIPENIKKARIRSKKAAKKISKSLIKYYENYNNRKEHSNLMKQVMAIPKIKKNFDLAMKKRRNVPLEKSGHKPDCKCTFCMQKRGDNSWITEKIIKSKSQTLKKRMKENPEKWKPIYINAGENAFKSNIKNRPYIWQDVHFMSKLEMECAKLLLSKPIAGVNCNININGKFIDFFPQLEDKQYIGCFVEFHPWDSSGLTTEEYYKQRKQNIKNSDYQDIPLTVITNLNELKKEII